MIKVREAKKEDVNDIYNLIVANARYHNQEKHVLTDKENLEKYGFGPASQFGVLIAEINGKIIGYVSYTWNYSIWLGEFYMNIDDLYIYDEYRGMKAGEALMKKAKELSKSRGGCRLKWEVEQNNQKAIKFYKRLGAEIVIKGVGLWDIV